MACSEKKRLANQRNALKSTGPRTEEGKEQSRANALKHGLTGLGTVLTEQDRGAMSVRVEEYRAHLAPVDVLEECLVERAALASLRLERCVEQETVELGRRRQRARARWEHAQRLEVNALAKRLEDEPAYAARYLLAFTRGCEWLIEEWQGLADAIGAEGFWTHEQAAHALRLLGKAPEAPHPGDVRVAEFRINFLAARPEVDAAEVNAVLGEPFEDEDVEEGVEAEEAVSSRLPSREAGCAVLKAIVAEQLERLGELRDQLWEEQDQPERDELEARTVVDTSQQGARLHKYENNNELSLHRNVNLLVRLRRIEPEHQTISRWNKTGHDKPRRWVGTGWMPWPDENEQYDNAPAAEWQAAPAAEPCEAPAAEAPETTAGVDTNEVLAAEANEPEVAAISSTAADPQNEATAEGSTGERASTLVAQPIAPRSPYSVTLRPVIEAVEENDRANRAGQQPRTTDQSLDPAAGHAYGEALQSTPDNSIGEAPLPCLPTR
jgi:hypothetical protein